jgi:hypothetical protein
MTTIKQKDDDGGDYDVDYGDNIAGKLHDKCPWRQVRLSRRGRRLHWGGRRGGAQQWGG